MRKEYSERLEAEKCLITQSDELHQSLSNGIENMKDSILDKGDNSKWKFASEKNPERSAEARKHLLAASGLGLVLTVQLLGLDDVELRPLPEEKTPVEAAQEKNHLHMLYVLCRDLKMAPQATHNKSLLPKKIGINLRIAECNIFKNCSVEKEIKLLINLEQTSIDHILNGATKIEETTHDWSLYDSDIFYVFARYGLMNLLDNYMKVNGKSELDKVMQNYSNSTMLHISVLYGQKHITQYLLHHGASPIKETIGGYTAAHIAALVGHKDSMRYILSNMKCKDISTEGKCNFEMTAVELYEQYEKMRKGSKYPFLGSVDARCIKNEIKESDMAFQILKRKSKELEISNSDQLMKKVKELHCSREDVKMKDIISETKRIFQDIGGSYKGNLKEVGQYFENHSLFNNEIVEFVLELDSEAYSAYGKSKNITLEERQIEDGIMILKLKKNYEGNINQNNIFMRNFVNAIKNRIKDYEPSNKNINLCPPFLIPYTSRVEICWACNLEGNLYRVQSYVALVIKADLPEKNGLEGLPTCIKNLCNGIPAELHVATLKGDWTYRGYSLESKIFESLDENQNMVWRTCRFIKLLSKQYWWNPTSNDRKIVRRLDENFVGVKFPTERALKALFLNELAETPYQWEKEDIFDRVIGIYRRCLTTDNVVLRVKSFLIPTAYISPMITESVIGVVRYLESLK